jgi:hypothetical protein
MRKAYHNSDDKVAPAHRHPIAKFLMPAETLHYQRIPHGDRRSVGQSAGTHKGMETAKAWFPLNLLHGYVFFGVINAFVKKGSYAIAV